MLGTTPALPWMWKLCFWNLAAVLSKMSVICTVPP